MHAQSALDLKGVKDPWGYMHGCLEHLHHGTVCLGSLLNAQSPDTTGESMIPATAELLEKMHPGRCTRDCMPSSTILYMGPGGHRQGPMSIVALVDRFFSLCALQQRAQWSMSQRQWRLSHSGDQNICKQRCTEISGCCTSANQVP